MWTLGLPNRAFELKTVKGIYFRIGLGIAWNREDPTATRDDIVDIAGEAVRTQTTVRAKSSPGKRLSAGL